MWVWLTASVIFLIGLLTVAALFSDVLKWVPVLSAVPLGICAGAKRGQSSFPIYRMGKDDCPHLPSQLWADVAALLKKAQTPPRKDGKS
jgi:hypothetical protein